jgi:predicted DNA-binding protein (MmcQ/YjbR family)
MGAEYAPKTREETELRAHGLAFPATREDFPWGHRALKVKDKIFAIFGWDGPRFSLSTKLTKSNTSALDRPFAEPTHYGMGKHGWVTARFEQGERVPVELLKEWIDESYRAIAPKKVLEALDGKPAAKTPRRKASAPKGSKPPKASVATARPATKRARSSKAAPKRAAPRASR